MKGSIRSWKTDIKHDFVFSLYSSGPSIPEFPNHQENQNRRTEAERRPTFWLMINMEPRSKVSLLRSRGVVERRLNVDQDSSGADSETFGYNWLLRNVA